MATINPAGFASVDIATSDNLTIKLVPFRPTPNAILSENVLPGKVVGFYNPDLDLVEIFVASAAGNYYHLVGG